ncbi:MAG: undecaprenyl-diphosphate phosphatase [Erysipelotrichaceae bacterium]|nr:undecaprenyl-diphosphate phosphatase [Erysipelotrichaceae bacterium]
MLEILKAILFGIVEGITEWLPVSSTGHMIILNEFVTMNCSADFWEFFLVVIQLGAIIAVIILFWDSIFPFQFKDKNKPVIKMETIMLWVKVVVACIPAAVVGILFDDVFEALFYHAIPVAIALIVFGVLFIVVEELNRNKKPRIKSLDDIGFKEAIIIGIFQLIAAVFPGTSRSGATIVGALMIGVSRSIASEFTFIMAIPVMFGASLLKVIKLGLAFTANEFILLAVGMIVAFVVSLLVIKALMNFVKKHSFTFFGFYRIILGMIIIVLEIMGVITV